MKIILECWRASSVVSRRYACELRQVQVPPFNLIIVDGNEAMWGEFKPKDEDATTYLWTNDPVHVGILKTSFEKLWKDSSLP